MEYTKFTLKEAGDSSILAYDAVSADPGRYEGRFMAYEIAGGWNVNSPPTPPL